MALTAEVTDLVKQKHLEQRGEIVEWADALEITNNETFELAAERLTGIKALQKAIMEDFEPSRKSLDKAKKDLLAQRNAHLEPLAEAERAIKAKIGGWQRLEHERQERERRAAMEKARKDEEERRQHLALVLESQGADEAANAVIDAPVVVAAPPPPVAPKATGISTRKAWKFRITDQAAIPRDYMMPDEKAIGQVVRAMRERTNIPGVEVYSEDV
jgi:hypothetical protein